MDSGFMVPAIILGFVVLMFIGYFAQKALDSRRAQKALEKEQERLRLRIEFYTKKYGDRQVGTRIAMGHVWQGETADQLRDSMGAPEDVDQKVMKAKIREVWKYRRTGVNRYAVKITLENDVVVGWDL